MLSTALPLALCLTLAAAAPSQQEAKPSPPLEQQPFDLDFPGGTLGQLLKVLEGKVQERPNFLATPKASALQVPPLKLTRVNLESLLNVLPEFITDKDRGTRLRISSSNRKSSPRIHTFYLQVTGPRINRAGDRTQVFNLTDLLGEGKYKIEDLVTAIETGWAMGNKSKNYSLKFHEETRLLLVRGPGECLGLVSDVIRQLQGNSTRKKELARLRAENEELRLRLTRLEKELAALKGKSQKK